MRSVGGRVPGGRRPLPSLLASSFLKHSRQTPNRQGELSPSGSGLCGSMLLPSCLSLLLPLPAASPSCLFSAAPAGISTHLQARGTFLSAVIVRDADRHPLWARRSLSSLLGSLSLPRAVFHFQATFPFLDLLVAKAPRLSSSDSRLDPRRLREGEREGRGKGKARKAAGGRQAAGARASSRRFVAGNPRNVFCLLSSGRGDEGDSSLPGCAPLPLLATLPFHPSTFSFFPHHATLSRYFLSSHN